MPSIPPIPEHSRDEQEREYQRTHPRYQLKLPVNLHAERWSRGLLVDISRGGMWLRANSSEALGQRLQVKMRRYCESDTLCTAEGRVVRVSSMPRVGGFAVEFDRNDVNMDALLDATERQPAGERSTFLSTELRPTLEISRI